MQMTGVVEHFVGQESALINSYLCLRRPPPRSPLLRLGNGLAGLSVQGSTMVCPVGAELGRRRALCAVQNENCLLRSSRRDVMPSFP